MCFYFITNIILLSAFGCIFQTVIVLLLRFRISSAEVTPLVSKDISVSYMSSRLYIFFALCPSCISAYVRCRRFQCVLVIRSKPDINQCFGSSLYYVFDLCSLVLSGRTFFFLRSWWYLILRQPRWIKNPIHMIGVLILTLSLQFRWWCFWVVMGGMSLLGITQSCVCNRRLRLLTWSSSTWSLVLSTY